MPSSTRRLAPLPPRRRRFAGEFISVLGTLAVDFALLGAAFAAALLLDLEGAAPKDLLRENPWIGTAVLVELGFLALFGFYNLIWRYLSFRDVQAVVAAATTSAAALFALRLATPPDAEVRPPSAALAGGMMLGFGAVVGLRVAARAIHERRMRNGVLVAGSRARKTPTLLVGAGEAGVLAARQIVGRSDAELDVRGFIDDDPGKHGMWIYGIKVLGGSEDIPRLVKELAVAQVVITIARIPRADILRIMEVCRGAGVPVRIFPGLSQILEGKVKVSRIRDVEIDDLLGRAPVLLEEERIAELLKGKTVMVTGAGGSIGSELVRQIARFSPGRLLLVERAEFALFPIEQELLRRKPPVPIVPLLADIGDETRMRGIFETHRPEVVFHAAAHKHVPMMEMNPGEAIKNNVLATRLLGTLAGESGVEVFVMISTDKAVRPTSVMGASKRVAELVVQDLAARFPTRFVAVRFGNVMGSAGSVLHTFREQIRAGGPVTVTHPDVQRYFMTIPEASQLVLQAGAMGQGGEIFVLDMGRPVRILDLAAAMIGLTGLRPFEDMDIVFTGLRPGEKLFEELQLAGEDFERTRHPKIYTGNLVPLAPERLAAAVEELARLAEDGESAAIRGALARLLPEAFLGGAPEVSESESLPARAPEATGAAGPRAA